jgi:hypothetical protein
MCLNAYPSYIVETEYSSDQKQQLVIHVSIG